MARFLLYLPVIGLGIAMEILFCEGSVEKKIGMETKW
ncbi:hypothetical protein Cycma_3308 [Cyclobacterium marinum DSM 745]|uniref:Uncharacterized protein n=1 Tax=Cyclobacterium marinum (strain ATCC 25205 / DSM 745 / LMG 13164 / NCIMB 1802) TaxID=880070 RepID=G0IV41_CYCMS|nr:hypothetical protein Cycma_3308 [Cyclobacterium marinum DSM 745]